MLRDGIAASLTAFFVFSQGALAQDARGTILGRVTDPSGAVVAGASVQAVNAGTRVAAATRTNQSGNYALPFLLPGTYTVQAEIQGFKKYVRDRIEVRIADAVQVDMALEIGSAAESVEVKAETPLLSTAESSLGQVVDMRRIQDLPSFGGNALILVQLAPGTTNGTDLRIRKTAHTQGGSQFVTDGAGLYNNEFTMDGVSDTQAGGTTAQVAAVPPTTAIGEFKVQTAPFDASIGHTVGALVNMSIRSGTNDLHGEAHWWVRNRVFDAPNLFQNRSGTKLPVYQDNRYGASAGAPVILPKAYNGRNRTFWFYAWEENRFGVPQTFVGSVPNEAARRGDLSYLLKLGANYQVYDPFTTAPAAGGRFSRQPFAGNLIPASRVSPVAANIMKLWPLPSQPGTADGRSNWVNSDTSKQRSWTHIGRLDHAFSQSHRLFLRLNRDYWQSQANRTYSTQYEGILVKRANQGLALDDVYVINPSLLVNVRYGITRQTYTEKRLSQGYDLSTLGFSQNFLNLIEKPVATIPYVSVAPFSLLGAYSEGDGAHNVLTHSLLGSVTKYKGDHSLRAGSDYRVYRKNHFRRPFDVSPNLTFNSTYTRGPLDSATAPTLGGEITSFLLGVPGGQMTRSASYAEQDQYLGLYLQDDWKAGKRLTVNAGLRWDYETPITERYNRSVSQFAFDVSNPIEAQTRANYSQSPIAEIPASLFVVRGGLTFAGVGGNSRSLWQGDRGNFMPRAGLAYQLFPKTVVRAGYGLFFDTIGTNKTQSIQSGFSQSTPIQPSLDSGLTYTATLANPFPTGLIAPAGASGGLSTFLGQAITVFPERRQRPYLQRWSFNVQQVLPKQFLFEAGYVGNRGTRIGVNRNLNAVPAQYLSRLPSRDQARINYLSESFPNPLHGTNPIYVRNTSRAGLLAPYPQFGGVTMEEPVGYSWYHSLQTRLEKRYSRGFTVQMAYTWSKSMEAAERLNASDAVPYEGVSPLDRMHRVVVSGIWDLPVGRGRSLGKSFSRPVDLALGGWQLNFVVQRQSGPPLAFGDVWTLFTGNPDSVKLSKDKRSVDRWFNIDAGFNRNTAQQLGSNIRVSPLRFSGPRADGQARWDFSLFKDFRITERAKFQFRAECVNAWNHPNLLLPVTTPTASTFGMITSQDVPRVWLLNANISF